MICRETMNAKVITCRENEWAAHCAELMRDHNIGFVPILNEKDEVLGIVTDRDLAIRLVAFQKPYKTKVSEFMTTEVYSVFPEADLKDAERLMIEKKVSRLLVIDKKKHLLGVISLSDIARVEEFPKTGELLRAVVQREVAFH